MRAGPALASGARTAAPQPFQYQGSKRSLAPLILGYLPGSFNRLVEPFAGSAAVSLACAAAARCSAFWLNDLNGPLSDLLSQIVNRPEATARSYEALWRALDSDHVRHYGAVRDEFNCTGDPRLLLYLLARCVKGSVRYNIDGEFNQSPDKRRPGTKPARMRAGIMAVSCLLRGRSEFTSLDYRVVLDRTRADDVVYMDPPYQGVCGHGERRYYAAIRFEEFVRELEDLNQRKIPYLVSYDGRTGEKSHGEPLPSSLGLERIEIAAGRSAQSTLQGGDSLTVESLYLSEALGKRLSARRVPPKRRKQQSLPPQDLPCPA